MSILIARIRAKSQEDGDCLIWHGAMAGGVTPVIQFEGKVQNVRRALAIQLGLDVDKKTATNSCDNRRCVCPDHIKVMTRKALQVRSAKALKGSAQNVIRGMRISAARRPTAKHTAELAQQIREADGPQRAIAARFGVSHHVVWSIRTHRTWKNYNNPYAQLMGGRR